MQISAILNKVIWMIQIIKNYNCIWILIHGIQVLYCNISNLMNETVQLILNVKAFEFSSKIIIKICDH